MCSSFCRISLSITPIVFDWEQTSVDGSRTADATGEQITSYASAFCKKIAKAGYTAGVYFNRSLGYNYYDLEQLKDFEFWLAEYRSVPAFYYNFGLWQYSDNAQVQGIDDECKLVVRFDGESRPAALNSGEVSVRLL